MVESLVIEVPVELVEGLDDIVMLMGFRSREEFALVAARAGLSRNSSTISYVYLND
jgi:metal-responsive CopG/Arc/MetJ family transcriptional regulator